jgi:hypothetical protein
MSGAQKAKIDRKSRDRVFIFPFFGAASGRLFLPFGAPASRNFEVVGALIAAW